jgi:hypothetical protein
MYTATLKEMKPHLKGGETAADVRTLLKKHSSLPPEHHEAFVVWLSQRGE